MLNIVRVVNQVVGQGFQTHPDDPQLLPRGFFSHRHDQAILAKFNLVAVILVVIIQDYRILQITP